MTTSTHRHRARAAVLGVLGGAFVMAAALPSQAVESSPSTTMFEIAPVQLANATTLEPAPVHEAAMALPVKHYHLSARFNDGGGNWSSGHHTGLDFGDAVGVKVRAPQAGIVVKEGFDGPYGNSIVIKHADGLKTRYGHLSRILVTKGEHVTEGQLIGRVGDTGNTTGPHLHFEVIRNGKPVDPEKYLWQGRTIARA